jgi:hypothetical protein
MRRLVRISAMVAALAVGSMLTVSVAAGAAGATPPREGPSVGPLVLTPSSLSTAGVPRKGPNAVNVKLARLWHQIVDESPVAACLKVKEKGNRTKCWASLA